MIKLVIFWGSWAYFPLAALCIWALLRGQPAIKVLAAAVLTLSSVLAYARFVEPQRLVTHRETIVLPGATETSPAIRIALFGDPHIGLFGNAVPIRRIVARINEEGVQAVFLAGDLTYHPDPDDIPEDFAALADLDAPLFAVLGNHDVGRPGNDLTDPLLAALGEAGAVIAHNRAIETDIGGRAVVVSGASDLWQRRQDFGFTSSLPAGKPVILLTHNPDTALVVPDAFAYDLMLAGHTHGGQVRIPGIYQKILPVSGPFDKELHRFATPAADRLFYVSPGTGMVGVAMRFMMAPRVDILTIHLPE
ncbi:MAG: metallophosphoesterase [Hyphomonas sp.]|nr:metallophosphoesterase [Hyphomonas sp.]